MSGHTAVDTRWKKGTCQRSRTSHRPWAISHSRRYRCLAKESQPICYIFSLRRKNGLKSLEIPDLYFDQHQSTELWCQFSHCKVQVSYTQSHDTCSLWGKILTLEECCCTMPRLHSGRWLHHLLFGLHSDLGFAGFRSTLVVLPKILYHHR